MTKIQPGDKLLVKEFTQFNNPNSSFYYILYKIVSMIEWVEAGKLAKIKGINIDTIFEIRSSRTFSNYRILVEETELYKTLMTLMAKEPEESQQGMAPNFIHHSRKPEQTSMSLHIMHQIDDKWYTITNTDDKKAEEGLQTLSVEALLTVVGLLKNGKYFESIRVLHKTNSGWSYRRLLNILNLIADRSAMVITNDNDS